MPNKPRPSNPARPVRIEDDLWREVQRLAERRGVSASAIVRTAVAQYIKRSQR